ncbi:hypothetical protein EXIGLDRAFT_832626 [Exidia glandulosa HHB12029]|uniref:F-box domain-containing protein n=1 Tax=Exidia glandulosa HHB12029 TaxID=1314781 RepID=A0A165LIE0_EXIGL|nr:hypothetical protein EXIGLDRAFT_832626 [Exidia glandulosa HHB12029]
MSAQSTNPHTTLHRAAERTAVLVRTYASRQDWNAANDAQAAAHHVLRRTLISYICLVRKSWEDDRPSASLEHLPPKALERILHYLPLRSRLSLSNTCRHVRASMLAMAQLWSKVRMGPTPQVLYVHGTLDAARMPRQALWLGVRNLLRRGTVLPTRLSASFDPLCLRDASTMACLRSFLHDTTTVRLQPYTAEPVPLWIDPDVHYDGMGPPSSDAWSLFTTGLSTPAPRLESLEIIIPKSPTKTSWEDTMPLLLSGTTLGGTPGQLRSCHLNGVTLTGVLVSFSALTTFDYQPNPDTLSIEAILCILHDMPCLETLGLNASFKFEEAAEAVLESTSPIVHQHLARIALAVSRQRPMRGLPDNLAAVVAFFRIVCAKPDVAIVMDVRMGTDGPTFSSRYSLPKGFIDFPEEFVLGHRLTILRETNLTILACHRSMIRAAMPTNTMSFGNIVRLVIGEFRRPEVTVLSGNVPRLRSLCITLVTTVEPPATYRPHEEPNLFTSAALQPALDCPALEDVELAGESPLGFPFTLKCVISLADVCHFVRTGLRFAAPRLRTLALSGVSATTDPDPVAAFLAFQQLADDVSLREATSPEMRRLETLHDQRNFGRVWAPSHVFATKPLVDSRATDRFYALGWL